MAKEQIPQQNKYKQDGSAIATTACPEPEFGKIDFPHNYGYGPAFRHEGKKAHEDDVPLSVISIRIG